MHRRVKDTSVTSQHSAEHKTSRYLPDPIKQLKQVVANQGVLEPVKTGFNRFVRSISLPHNSALGVRIPVEDKELAAVDEVVHLRQTLQGDNAQIIRIIIINVYIALYHSSKGVSKRF